MDSNTTILGLSALAQGTRLDAFRLLASNERDGIAAGDLARQLGVPQNTLSAHLGVMSRAGLVRSERRSRSIIYRANIARLHELMYQLLRDCGNERLPMAGSAPAPVGRLVAEPVHR